jgi:hypothetical protein
MKYLFCLFLLLVFYCFSTQRVLAHGPGTLPFVKVNGQYTLFNPTYQSGNILNSAQDLPVGQYLKEKPIQFSIDISRIPFPSPLSNQFTFRWSFYHGSNFEQQVGGYFYGSQLVYTFPESGSYMVRLDARVLKGSFYTIDTLLLNVFPSLSYVYPKASINILTDSNHVLLQNNAVFDSDAKSADYLWDLGTNMLKKGKNVQTTIPFINNFPKSGITARVIDNKGLISDIFLRQETFTRQIDYDTVIYVNGTAKTQFGTITKTIQRTLPNSSGVRFVLGLSITAFLKNLLIIFLSMIALLVVRILLSFYGHN